jgi:hypothetical protein
MTAIPKRSRLRAARAYINEYAGAVTAAALMYGGTYQIISVLKHPVAIGIMHLINAVIRRGARGVMPLPDYGGIPWLLFTKFAAIGAVVLVVGLLIGLGVNVRSQRELRG